MIVRPFMVVGLFSASHAMRDIMRLIRMRLTPVMGCLFMVCPFMVAPFWVA